MDFKDEIKQLADRVAKMKDKILTEEATKNAFVMPFINCLGYDVFNPLEVVPEFIADIGIKKGEKVDYAILKDEKPIILIECKHWSSDLDPHNSQLFRYFHTTTAKFGILTNGIVYRFYTDLIIQNKMDDKPFFEFRIDDVKDMQIEKLKEFHKSYFSLDSIINTASELKFMSELRALIVQEISEPSDEFTRFFAKLVYPSIVTPKVLEQFRDLVKRSFSQYVNDAISDRLKSALATDQQKTAEIQKEELSVTTGSDEIKIVTTEEEREAFYIIKAIVGARIKANRVYMRDKETYCGILLDDNNRKPICRLHFNGKRKHISFFDSDLEEKVFVQTNSDLYDHASRFISVINKYEKLTTTM